MSPLRALIQDHARLTLALLALVLAVKALVPGGFMIAPGGERFLTVTVCADASGTPQALRIALPPAKRAGGDHPAAADTGQPCAFAGLGHAALGGTDPLLLAAGIAFALLIGIAARPALPARAPAFLRPPLRGPPASV